MHRQPYDKLNTVVFRRGGGAIRMRRAEASEAVARDPQNLSWDPRTDPQDIGSAHEIGFDFRQMPERELRELHARMRLPRGSKWSGDGQSGGHIVNVRSDAEQRFNRRWVAAMGVVR